MSDEKELQAKKRRRNALKLTAARYGIDTPPHISLEIEDLEKEIAELERSAASTPATTNSTTINGDVTGSVFSGSFHGPVTVSSTTGNAPDGSPKQVTILAAFAQPRGLDATEWEREVRELRTMLIQSARNYRIEIMPRCTPEELHRSLLHIRPNMLHFQGHGTSEGLVFEDSSGDSHRVRWKAMMRTLLSAETLECVILNACESHVHAQVGPQRFHLITTPGSVSTETTRAFTSGFYDALIAGLSIPQAYHSACNLLDLKGLPEEEWPVLTEGTGKK